MATREFHFRPTDTDSIDLLRAVTAWANAQPEDYWHPAPGKAMPFATVIGVYLAVVRHLGSSIDEVIDNELPFPFSTYSEEDRAAINYVRTAFGLPRKRA